MFNEFFRFELRYRKSRASTYVYFLIILFFCFVVVVSPNLKITGAVGQVSANAPFVITYLTLIMSFIFTMVTSAILGVAIVRDFDHSMQSILFTTPLKKGSYLFGRFTGALATLVIINCAVVLGLLIGYATGKFLPWEVSWKYKELLSFSFWYYLQPFLLFTLPNLFITGTLFFMAGALGRNNILIYTQGIALIVIYQIANTFLGQMDSQYIAAIIDPFGIHTFQYVTRYWTPHEQNTLLVPFEGVVFYNRLLWLSIGLLALVFTYYRFSFRFAAKIELNKSHPSTREVNATSVSSRSFTLRTTFPIGVRIHQIFSQAMLYFKMMCREVPFIAIVASGIALLLVKAFRIDQVAGTSSYPTTFAILELLNSFNLFFLILAVFYSGELIWLDRSVNFHFIQHVLPVPPFQSLLAKFLSLMMVYGALLLLLIVCGIVVQASYGYYAFELPVYLGTLYSSTFINLALITTVSFFIHVLTNNKFLGFVLCVAFIIVNASISQMGLEHDLWQFASGSLGVYSAMNKYGHFIKPFFWLKIYWVAFAILLFLTAVVLVVRGADGTLTSRWKERRQRITRPIVIAFVAAFFIFIFSGFYVYYNTVVINQFLTSDELLSRRAEYERTLGNFRTLNQPAIASVSIALDLFPSERNFYAKGYYYLRNTSSEAIEEIHVQHYWNDRLVIDRLFFEDEATVSKVYPEFRYTVYRLAQALQPSDSIRMDFKLSYVTQGFKEKEDTDLVYNGTYLKNSVFPRIGYNPALDITFEDDRKKYHLDLKPNKGIDTPNERTCMMLQVSTTADQIAIAPGMLKKEWVVENRRYFQYQISNPMNNSYSIHSARYHVKRDKWNDVNLEIFYHPEHTYNLDRMMEGMKDALRYCATNFGPYPYRQLRIVEFPRYEAITKTYPSTIPYSEGAGFILKVRDAGKDLDIPYYTTLHEVAHQWWQHNNLPEDVAGGGVLSEGLAQYCALMIMKEVFPEETVVHYLKYELDSYLKGRFAEKRKGQPLAVAGNQYHLTRHKASLVFFALQDYIGEENVNKALKKFYQHWNDSTHYPNVGHLLSEIQEVTPDSLRYIVDDLFNYITLFENRVDRAVYKKLTNGKYELTINITCSKIRSDDQGIEVSTSIHDWIDVGVYGADERGNPKLLYLKKHLFTAVSSRIQLLLDDRPVKVGIDPLCKLIDRHTTDNVINAENLIPLGGVLLENN